MHFMGDDTGDLPGAINPVDPFNLPALLITLFHVIPVPVARITEVDPTLGIHREVIGRIESFPLIVTSKHRNHSILFSPGHPTVPALTGHQVSLVIKKKPIRSPGGSAEDMHDPGRVTAHDPIISNIGEIHIARRMPCGAFGESNSALEFELRHIRNLGIHARRTYEKKGGQEAVEFHIQILLRWQRGGKQDWRKAFQA